MSRVRGEATARRRPSFPSMVRWRVFRACDANGRPGCVGNSFPAGGWSIFPASRRWIPKPSLRIHDAACQEVTLPAVVDRHPGLPGTFRATSSDLATRRLMLVDGFIRNRPKALTRKAVAEAEGVAGRGASGLASKHEIGFPACRHSRHPVEPFSQQFLATKIRFSVVALTETAAT
jgi:hypothetical protein